MSAHEKSEKVSQDCHERTSEHEAHGYALAKSDILVALKRIEGQVRGVHGMVDRDSYCMDILIQLAAIKGALSRVTMSMLESHLRGCVSRALEQGEIDSQHDHIEELLTLVRKFV